MRINSVGQQPAEVGGPRTHRPERKEEAARPSDGASESPARPSAALPDFPLQELSIRRDPDLNRMVVQVIDSQTGEVVRQIPPEDFVRALKRLRGAKGLFFDGEG